MKDTFKQNLVNELNIEEMKREEILFQRINEIFPELEILSLYKDFYDRTPTLIQLEKSQFPCKNWHFIPFMT